MSKNGSKRLTVIKPYGNATIICLRLSAFLHPNLSILNSLLKKYDGTGMNFFSLCRRRHSKLEKLIPVPLDTLS